MSSQPPSNGVTPLPELVHYFEVRSKSASDFISRTWQRLNWFMTVHLGAFGLIFSSLVKLPGSHWYFLVALVMGLTSLLWAALGYEDFQQFRVVTQECQAIEAKVVGQLKADLPAAPKKRTVLPFDHARIVYILPLMTLTAWLALAVYLF